MERAQVEWKGGGEARFLAIDGEAVTLASTVPAPPGSRVDGVLVGDGASVRIKVHGSKRRGDGSYVWTGRGIDWTRELREKVRALVAAAAGAAGADGSGGGRG